MIGPVHAISDEQRRARAWRRQALAAPVGDVEDGRGLGRVPARHRAAERCTSRSRRAAARRARRSTPRSTPTAPWSSSSRCAARCSASRASCCPAVWGSASRAGGRAAADPAGQGRRAGRPGRRRRGVGRGRRRRGPRRRGEDAGPATTTELRGLVPELDRRLGRLAGRDDAVAGRVLTVLAAEARLLRGDNELGWRVGPAPLDAAGQLAGGGPARTAGRGRGLPRPGRSLAGAVRSRHRDRPGVVAGRHQGGRAPCARRPRGRGGRPSTRAPPAGCCPTTSTTSPAGGRRGAAAGARPDPDGLEGARLLPRPGRRPPPVRHQRQRRHHRLVGRPRGGLLGPGRRRRRAGGAAPRRRRGGAPGPGRGGGAPDRLARRRRRLHASTPRPR